MLDLAILLTLIALWAIKAFVVEVQQWEDLAKKYGDPIHFTLGTLAARLAVDHSMFPMTALLSFLYVVYQLADGELKNWSEIAKDVATYVAGIVAYTATRLSIPL